MNLWIRDVLRHTAAFLGVLGCLVSLEGRRASAHPFDTWGFTSRDIAMGGAATASATDVDAAYYNPAAATRARALVVNLGLLVADDFLEVLGLDVGPAERPRSVTGPDTHVLLELGLATPIPLGEVLKDRLFLTLALALPYDGFYDVDQPDDEEIAFPFWDARNRRIVFTAALAGRIFDWLSVGVGFTILPDVLGEVRVSLSGEAARNASHVQVDYDFGATAGLLVEPLDWLAFGVAYRQAQGTTIDLPVAVDVFGGTSPVSARVTAPAYSQPHEVALGVQVRPLPTLTLAADVTWYDYSSFRFSSPDVVVYGAETPERPAARVRMRDVWAPRLGAEWQALPWLALRGGWAYVASPVPRQEGATNLLDADRTVLALGLGFDLPGEWLGDVVRRLSVDLHGQVAVLRERQFEKMAFLPDNPGYPRIGVSGGTFSAGVSLRTWF
jgi:long-chain fatty acid transport protein